MRLSLRAGALLAGGSLAVHELRFLVGFGDAEAVGGHGYLVFAAPVVAAALALALGTWLARIGRAATPASDRITWLGASCSLVLVYLVQEMVEGLAAAGHPGLFAHGGWAVVPIAVAVGGLIALALQGASAADRAAIAVAQTWSPPAVAGPVAVSLPRSAPAVPRPRVLARRLAGRGPPPGS